MTKHFVKKIGLGSAAALTGLQVQAADWSATTTAMDLSGETTAVISIVGILAAVAIVVKGGKIVLRMFGG